MVASFIIPSPSFVILSGSSASGKSHFVRRLIQRPDMFELPVSRFLYCYGIDRDELEGLGDNVDIHKGLPSHVVLENFLQSNPGHRVLILDDLLREASKERDLLHALATRLVSHACVTVLFLSQSLYEIEKSVRSNANMIILFKSENDVQSVATLGRQLFSGTRYRHFMSVYNSLFDEPYSHLCISLHPRCERTLKLTSDLFSPYPTVFLPHDFTLNPSLLC